MMWFNPKGGLVDKLQPSPTTLRAMARAMPEAILDPHGIRFHPVARRDTMDRWGDKIQALETRLTQLECAAKGHGATETKTLTGQSKQIGTENYVIDPGTPAYIEHRQGLPIISAPIYTRTTITCLDCGAEISDEWEPKEVEDGTQP